MIIIIMQNSPSLMSDTTENTTEYNLSSDQMLKVRQSIKFQVDA